MSRSYRKVPVSTDHKSVKETRSIANRKFRRKSLTEEVPKKSNIHKKYFEQYEIHDYVLRWNWEEALKDWEENEYLKKQYKTVKEFYRYWYKTMLGK